MSDAQVEVQGQQQATQEGQQTTDQTQGQQAAQQTEEGQQQAEGQTQEEQQTQEGQQTERDEKGRFKGVQSRIDELTRQRRESEREAAYWKQVASGAQQSAQAAPQRPVPENFEKYDDYVDALTDWKAEQAVNKRMAQDSERRVAETRAQTFEERQNQFRQQTTDYDAVVGGADTPLTPHVAQLMQGSELGPQLAYHFGKNPDVLMNLNRMDPLTAAREIGKLEASFESKTAAAPAAPAKKVSQTPAPAGTLGTQGRASAPAPGNMSMEDYKKMRAGQGARWAR